MIERCNTVEEAISSIRNLDELQGFIDAIRNSKITTKQPTAEEWAKIANRKIILQQGSRT